MAAAATMEKASVAPTPRAGVPDVGLEVVPAGAGVGTAALVGAGDTVEDGDVAGVPEARSAEIGYESPLAT